MLADVGDGQPAERPVVRLWPWRKSSREKSRAPERPEPELPLEDEGVDVKYVTVEELGDTTASLTLKEIIRAKAEFAKNGRN